MFKNIGIIGVGLIGGSIGLAVKQTWPATRVVGYGRNAVRLKKAHEYFALDQYSTSPEVLADCDFIIVCTPVDVIAHTIKKLLPYLAPNVLITDAGSTKEAIVRTIEHIAGQFRFVGSHPIAGKEKSGVGYAEAALFVGRPCVVVPTKKSDAANVRKVKSFWKSLGSVVLEMSAHKHDRILALSSHFPHWLMWNFIAFANNEQTAPGVLEKIVGSGFLDMTRISAGDAIIWRDIIVENKNNIATLLDRFIAQLQKTKKYLNDESGKEAAEFINAQARRRRKLAKVKSESIVIDKKIKSY